METELTEFLEVEERSDQRLISGRPSASVLATYTG